MTTSTSTNDDKTSSHTTIDNPLVTSQQRKSNPKNRGLSWQGALDYRTANMPSIGGEILPYKSKVGRFCKDNCCNRNCDPCCEGLVSAFVPFGSFITSYFKFEKALISLFMLLTVLSIPAICINTFAGQSGAPVLSIASTTLGNLPMISFSNNTLTDAFLTLPYSNGMTLPISSCAIIYAGLDFVSVVCFLLFIGAVRQGLIIEEKQVLKNALGPEKYSIFLPDIPPETTEKDLIEWAQVVSATRKRPQGYQVWDVNIVDDNMGLLRIFEIRGGLYRAMNSLALREADLLSSIGNRAPGCFERSKLRSLREAMRVIRERIDVETQTANDFKSAGATAAFITFSSTTGPRVVLDRFPNSFFARCCQPERLNLLGMTVTVKPAPAPATILWPNLNIKDCGRSVRQSITGLLAFLLIIFSFIFIVYATIYSSQAEATLAAPDCTPAWLGESFTNGTLTSSSIASFSSESIQSKCFCSTQIAWSEFATFEDVSKNSLAQRCKQYSCVAMVTKSVSKTLLIPYCYDYLYSRSVALGLVIGAALSIAVVNYFLSSSMRAMSVFEGHASSQDLNVALVLRLFFAQLFNTALLQIIINAAWDTLTGVTLPIGGTGRFDDFTPGWYNSVGASFHSTMITLAITPIVNAVISLCLTRNKLSDARLQAAREKLKLAKQNGLDITPEMYKNAQCKIGKAIAPSAIPANFETQEQFNDSFLNPPTDYVLRLVALLNTLFVCFIFSSGMPLMIPIAACSFIIAFTIDKAIFLWVDKKPNPENNAVMQYIIDFFPLAALLHIGIGVWMLGSVSSFKSAIISSLGLYGELAAAQAKAAVSAGTAVSRVSIVSTGLSRMSTPQTIPLVILFALVLAALFLKVVITIAGSAFFQLVDLFLCGLLTRCSCKRKHIEDDDGSPPYKKAITPPLRGTEEGINGILSYNILENPDLQKAFKITPGFASTNKGISIVASFSADDALKAEAAFKYLMDEATKLQVERDTYGKPEPEPTEHLNVKDIVRAAVRMAKIETMPHAISFTYGMRVMEYVERFGRKLLSRARENIKAKARLAKRHEREEYERLHPHDPNASGQVYQEGVPYPSSVGDVFASGDLLLEMGGSMYGKKVSIGGGSVRGLV